LRRNIAGHFLLGSELEDVIRFQIGIPFHLRARGHEKAGIQNIMKALIYEGEMNLTFKEIPKPRLENGEAFIKVAFAGICGTDLHIFAGKHLMAKAPLIMGHEFSCTVTEL